MKQNNYTAQDIERYHSGKLSSAEMHALEKAALDDLFLADALEGYQHTQTATADLASLQQKLEARIQNEEGKRKVLFIGNNWMKIAALFILLAGGGWLVLQMFSDENKKVELAITHVTPEQTPPPPTQTTTGQPTADSAPVYRDMTANKNMAPKDAYEKKRCCPRLRCLYVSAATSGSHSFFNP